MPLTGDWQKSPASGQSGYCVEARRVEDGTIQVRNSRKPHMVPIDFTPREWDAFLDGVRGGETFNLQ